MSFDFSKIAELSTARGKLVELKNSAGRVIWAVKSGGEIIPGYVTLRPSADISVEHMEVPRFSLPAIYMYINEEESDGDSTYIQCTGYTMTSTFGLDGASPPRGATITDVTMRAVRWSGTKEDQDLSLYVNGVKTATATMNANASKDFDGRMVDAVAPINDYFATNGRLPPMELEIVSYFSSSSSGSKLSEKESGITCVSVDVAYQ